MYISNPLKTSYFLWFKYWSFCYIQNIELKRFCKKVRVSLICSSGRVKSDGVKHWQQNVYDLRWNSEISVVNQSGSLVYLRGQGDTHLARRQASNLPLPFELKSFLLSASCLRLECNLHLHRKCFQKWSFICLQKNEKQTCLLSWIPLSEKRGGFRRTRIKFLVRNEYDQTCFRHYEMKQCLNFLRLILVACSASVQRYVVDKTIFLSLGKNKILSYLHQTCTLCSTRQILKAHPKLQHTNHSVQV